MRIGITTMPPRGVAISLISGSNERCLARFFKDQETNDGADGNLQLTANVVEIEMIFYDGLQEELESNFDGYFEKARVLELNAEKAKALASIENELIKTDYKCWKHADGDLSDEEYSTTKEIRANLRVKYRNVEKAETLETLSKIANA